MRTKISLLVALIIVSCLLLVGFTRGRASSAKTLWEYKVIKPTPAQDMEPVLNKLGAEGWELVQVGDPDNVRSYYLKRPRR